MPDGDFRLEDQLSPQQQDARDAIVAWLRRGDRQTFYLAGLAGTGKTHLVARLGRELAGVQYASFTGKAASVLRNRGADNAATLHGLLYGAPTIKDGELIWRRRHQRLSASLLVADECSTIDKALGRDLLKTGVKVLVTGDPAQLPPVGGATFFRAPAYTLTEIHRQAAGSQPLTLATAIRQGERIASEPFDIDAAVEADVVIASMNRTRRELNHMIRRARGISDKDPIVGDRVVALRNDYKRGVFNGELFTIEAVKRGVRLPRSKAPADMLLRMELVDDIGARVTVVAHDDGFRCTRLDLHDREYADLDLLDFGYALTAHKAQGSEFSNVAVIDETDSPGFQFIAGSTPLPEFKRRWLYSALTRAKQQVTVMRAPR